MNQKNIITLLFLVVLIIIGGVLMFDIGRKAPEPYLMIASFEECVNAGYPVMESFPRRCNTPDGKTFAEFVPTSRDPIVVPQEEEQATSTYENQASSISTSTITQ